MRSLAPARRAAPLQPLASSRKSGVPSEARKPFSRACRAGSRAKRTSVRVIAAQSYACRPPRRGRLRDPEESRGSGALEVPLDELDELAAMHCPEDAVGHLAVLEEDEGGNGRDLIFHRDRGRFVHVDLRDGQLAEVLIRQLVDDRGHRAAGTAPGSPEVPE